ncbi:hypothetical protein H2508_01645 [Parahaliea sp. F7430]|uniref:Type 4 fimbrial biogenesis protein PilX N-terminal domain-containing protein n=1 Tax=Sediminihaliea albiluteola TaxID=2758564 RepID=A0A7W2TTT9_9GAMM|nr:hypothetical protein [Sediminihaliea albiluteola]MBA6411811.1 hypothetical protein [Sediminihaliea albiluteola]
MSDKLAGQLGPIRQAERGIATLAIALLLLMIATVITLGTTSSVVSEQRLSGVDSRSKEVYAAASGALQLSLEWLEENLEDVVWVNNGSGVRTATLNSLSDSDLANDSYARSALMTLLTEPNPADPATPVVVRIEASAQAKGDSHIRKKLTTEVMIGKSSIFGPAGGGTITGFDGPPLLLENCLSGVTGNPTIINPNHTGVLIGTTEGTGGNTCINTGHFDKFVGVPDKKNPKGVALENGDIQALSPSMSLAEAVFGVDQASAKAMLIDLARREPERVKVYSDDNTKLPKDLNDSSVGPYIAYFTEDAGCPKTTGGTEFWGILYIEKTDCNLNGMGNVTIRGVLAQSGNLEKFNANTKLVKEPLDFGDVDSQDDPTINIGIAKMHFFEVPGAWRDF